MRLARALIALMALGVIGHAAAQTADVLPKRPIPYRLLEKRLHPRPKKAATPGSKTPTQPPPARPGLSSPGLQAGAAGPAAHGPPETAPSRPPAAASPAQPVGTQRLPPPAPAAASPAPPPPDAPAGPSPQAGVPVRPRLPPPAPPVQAPALPTAAAAPSPAGSLSPEQTSSFIDGVVASSLTRVPVRGLEIAVVQNGQVLFLKAYGDAAPGRPLDPTRTRVRLGEVSSALTWLLVAREISRGRLAPGDLVNMRLPPEQQIPDEGFQRPLRLLDLMANTGGFEDRVLGRRYVADPNRLLPLDAALVRLRPRRVRPAGNLAVPSPFGVAVAGVIAARSEGADFDTAVETGVLKPLGLARTTFREPYPAVDGLPAPLPESTASEFAQGQIFTREGFQTPPFVYGQSLAPAVAASSTASDMARFMTAVLERGSIAGVQVFDAAAASSLVTPAWSGIAGVQSSSRGLAQRRLPDGLAAYVVNGGAPGFAATLGLVPSLHLGIFAFADTDRGAPLIQALLPALAERIRPAPGAGEPLPYDAGPAGGAYLPAQRAYHGLEAFLDRLLLPVRLYPSSDATGLVLAQGADARPFRSRGEGRFTSADGQDLYLVDGGGRAIAYLLGGGGGAAERIDFLRSLPTLATSVLATCLVIVASFGGVLARSRTEPRETPQQTLAGAFQLLTCLIWTAAFAAFAVFARSGVSLTRLMATWPDPTLILASWLALFAAILSLGLLTQLPSVWREGRRVAGWSLGRKLRHTGGAFAFLCLTLVLAAWGALEPWSS